MLGIVNRNLPNKDTWDKPKLNKNHISRTADDRRRVRTKLPKKRWLLLVDHRPSNYTHGNHWVWPIDLGTVIMSNSKVIVNVNWWFLYVVFGFLRVISWNLLTALRSFQKRNFLDLIFESAKSSADFISIVAHLDCYGSMESPISCQWSWLRRKRGAY